MRIGPGAAALLCIGAACNGASGAEPSAARQACLVETSRVALPDGLRESSGIARTASGELWTHNDGAEARIYRVTEGGDLAQRVIIEGVDAIDVEDIDAAPCGMTSECLYVADTGDNDAERVDVRILVLPVPADGAVRSRASVVTARYPQGPRDAEALAVLPGGEMLLITKGRGAPIELYRVGLPAANDAAVALERVALLAAAPDRAEDRVTGAAASEDGRWIAVRTNAELRIHRSDELLTGEHRPVLAFDLRPLAEPQGEGVEIAGDGRVWLTSEAEEGGTPVLARLRCSLPR